MGLVTGKSVQAPDDAEESEDDDVDISDVSDKEDEEHAEDWDRALPLFSTRPRTQRPRALGDLSAAKHSAGACLRLSLRQHSIAPLIGSRQSLSLLLMMGLHFEGGSLSKMTIAGPSPYSLLISVSGAYREHIRLLGVVRMPVSNRILLVTAVLHMHLMLACMMSRSCCGRRQRQRRAL